MLSVLPQANDQERRGAQAGRLTPARPSGSDTGHNQRFQISLAQILLHSRATMRKWNPRFLKYREWFYKID
jgi:hypothetical protein